MEINSRSNSNNMTSSSSRTSPRAIQYNKSRITRPHPKSQGTKAVASRQGTPPRTQKQNPRLKILTAVAINPTTEIRDPMNMVIRDRTNMGTRDSNLIMKNMSRIKGNSNSRISIKFEFSYAWLCSEIFFLIVFLNNSTWHLLKSFSK